MTSEFKHGDIVGVVNSAFVYNEDLCTFNRKILGVCVCKFLYKAGSSNLDISKSKFFACIVLKNNYGGEIVEDGIKYFDHAVKIPSEIPEDE